MSQIHSVAQIKGRFSNDEFKLIIRALTDELSEVQYEEARELGARLMDQLIKDESHRLDVLKGARRRIDEDAPEPVVKTAPMPEVTFLRPGSLLGREESRSSGSFGGPMKSNQLS